MINHKNPKRWSELTAEEKDTLLQKKKIVLDFLVQNHNRKLLWEPINKIGLWHWYNFFNEGYNLAK